MLKRIKDKLRDEGGVTILMALFALLVAALVCVVILSAATSTVKQAHADRQSQQDQLTLECAGNMIATSMLNSEYAYTKVETREATSEEFALDAAATGSSVTKDCIIKDKLKGSVDELLLSAAPPTYAEGAFYIRASSGEVAPGDSPQSQGLEHEAYESLVKVEYVIEPTSSTEHPITFTIELIDGSSVSDTLYLSMGGSITKIGPNESDNGLTRTTTISCIWDKPTFYRAGDMINEE